MLGRQPPNWFSTRLGLADTARPGQIPRFQISEKSILYQSPIVFTPLLDDETIDVTRLMEWIRKEYVAGGVDPHQVETGAVIITGETAKKKNADQILQALGGMAGEFVVTVAGPHLEFADLRARLGGGLILPAAFLPGDQRRHRRGQRQLSLI